MTDSNFFLVLSTGLVSFSLAYAAYRWQVGDWRRFANQLIAQAEREAAEIRSQTLQRLAEEQVRRLSEDSKEQREKQKAFQLLEEQIRSRELLVSQELTFCKQSKEQLAKREAILSECEEKLEEQDRDIREQHKRLLLRMAEVAKWELQEARTALREELIRDIENSIALQCQQRLESLQQEVEQKATQLLATVMQRLAGPLVQEVATTLVSLPSEEMKSRIVGKEGKNIRTFETVTGVTLLVDDHPSAVVLSSFDPFRRAVARRVLLELLEDGKIYPSRIESVAEQAKRSVAQEVKQRVETATRKLELHNLHPQLLSLLGELSFRESSGQNLLEHSIQVAWIMGMVAGELGIDPLFARRIGLLHDIGKAAPPEMKGAHAEIGANICQQCGEDPRLVMAVATHHEDSLEATMETVLLSIAERLSGGRPGARSERESDYFQRMSSIEEVAAAFPGVLKAYVLQAGRELIAMVEPESVSDSETLLMARRIASALEQRLHYSGPIRVVVLRETKAVAYASPSARSIAASTSQEKSSQVMLKNSPRSLELSE